MFAEGIEINTGTVDFVNNNILKTLEAWQRYGSPEEIQRERAYEFIKGAINFSVYVGTVDDTTAVKLLQAAEKAFFYTPI